MPSITFCWPALAGLSLATIIYHPTPSASSHMFLIHGATHSCRVLLEGRGRAEGEEKSEVGSMLGLNLKTLRLWPEPESEVGYLPGWATHMPRDLLTHFCHQTISCSFIPQSPSWALSWETFSTTCRQGSLLGASLVYLQVSLDSAVTLFYTIFAFLGLTHTHVP